MALFIDKATGKQYSLNGATAYAKDSTPAPQHGVAASAETTVYIVGANSIAVANDIATVDAALNA